MAEALKRMLFNQQSFLKTSSGEDSLNRNLGGDPGRPIVENLAPDD